MEYYPIQPPILVRNQSPESLFRYKEYRPCDALRSSVACYWTIRYNPTSEAYLHRIIPDGCVDIIFDLEQYDLFQAGVKLAIWNRKDLAHETKVPLTTPSSTEMTIGHNVASKEEVDRIIELAGEAGAVITDPPHDAFWGGYSGHFQDPDGHLWEIVWNPAWEIND